MSARVLALVERSVSLVFIFVLILVVFVVLNPDKRLVDLHDARRASDANALLTAIHKSISDNKGAYPVGLSAGMAETQIGTSTTMCAISTGACAAEVATCVDLTMPLAPYIKSMPVDPTTSYTATKTGYTVAVDINGIVTVKACGSEGATDISVSR